MKVADLKNVIDETLKILENKVNNPAQTAAVMPLPPSTIRCHFCEETRDLKLVRGFNICQYCFAISYQAVQEVKASKAA